MKFNLKKYFIPIISLLVLCAVFALPLASQAAYSFDPGGTIKNISTLPTSNTSPGERLVLVIQVALMFMGAITVLLLVFAGFLWTTSGTNQENVGKAKKIILWTVVGMVFILGSYAITGFLTTSFTGSGSGGDGEEKLGSCDCDDASYTDNVTQEGCEKYCEERDGVFTWLSYDSKED